MDDVAFGRNGLECRQGLAALSDGDQLRARPGRSLMSVNACCILVCSAEIGAIIGRQFWRHDYGSRDVNKSAATSASVDGEVLKEDFSDHCIAEILGTTSVPPLH